MAKSEKASYFRTRVLLKSSLPDDATWGDNGVPDKPGGEELANTLRRGLSACGLQVGEVRQRSFYGWEFVATCYGRSFLCILQAYEDDWLLGCNLNRGLRSLLNRQSNQQATSRVLEAITCAVEANPSLSIMRWYTQEEIDADCQGGADSPV